MLDMVEELCNNNKKYYSDDSDVNRSETLKSTLYKISEKCAKIYKKMKIIYCSIIIVNFLINFLQFNLSVEIKVC